MSNKLTFAERTHSTIHRSPIILREADPMWYLAEFDNKSLTEEVAA